MGLADMRGDHERGFGRDQQRVAVRIGFCHHAGADPAGGAGTILDDDRLAQRTLQMRRQQPRHDVGSAARCKRHDDADRTGWIGDCPDTSVGRSATLAPQAISPPMAARRVLTRRSSARIGLTSLDEPQRVLCAKIGLHRRDVIAVARQHDHARVWNPSRVAFDRLDGLQPAFLRRHDQRRSRDARQLVLEFHVDARCRRTIGGARRWSCP